MSDYDSARLASVGRAREEARRARMRHLDLTDEQEAILYLEQQILQIRARGLKDKKDLFSLRKKLRKIEAVVLRSRERNATVIGTNLIANILKEGQE